MSIYLNIFPIVRYPEEIEAIILEYSDDNYKKYKDFCYRIGDKLYTYGDKLDDGQKISLTKGTMEFSLILRHLILKGVKDSFNNKKYRIEDRKKRLAIIREEPSIKTRYVEIFEKIEIQTIHWQDLNFGIVVDYLTQNNFTERFKTEKLNENDPLPSPSYSNFYNYLDYDEARNIMDKIGELKGEKVGGRMRSDALKERMSKIKEFLMDCLDWRGEEEKMFSLPSGESIIVSKKNVEILLLSCKEDANE